MEHTTQQKFRSADVPVIDLSQFGLDHDGEPSQEEWQRVARQLYDAFESKGCAYFINHGITDDQVNRTIIAGEAFFGLDLETKNRYQRDMSTFLGYVAADSENYDNAHELHEGFTIHDESSRFPDAEVPSLRPSMMSLMRSCRSLSSRILVALALSLGLERDFFLSMNTMEDNHGNSLRMNYYPPVPSSVLPDTTRFGAHCDFALITLLFQDNIGGLQMYDRDGQWLNIDPLPGGILINCGDFCKFFSDDKFISMRHRVVIPEEEVRRCQSRMSIACFFTPRRKTPLKTKKQSSLEGCTIAWEYLNKMMMRPYGGE